MKRKIIFVFVMILGTRFVLHAQQPMDLSEFTMSNGSSPAFVLLEETPTAIYTPNNLKSVMVHVQDNFGQSLSLEATPYFLVNTQRRNRTYQKYIGVMEDLDTGEVRQNPFSGLNTTTISFAYVDKEFAGLDGGHKTYSVGVRTTVLRFFNKYKVNENRQKIADALSEISPPDYILEQDDEDAIRKYYKDAYQDKIKPLQKTIKPIFRLDAALGYSTLFKENSISSGTVKRFGAWATSETSFILNEDSDAKTNNYFNLLLSARYIEDGFNAVSDDYFTTYYRDFGGKMAFEFGRIAFSYEYMSRNGDIKTERSVGNLTVTLTKDISISGGFGKDFEIVEGDNLVTIFGINWGLNTGNSKVTPN